MISGLPQAHHVLHGETDRCNTCPAAEPQQQRFAALFYKSCNIGVDTDGRHSHYNKKFAERFKRAKYRRWNSRVSGNCCYHRCENEI